MIEFQTLEKIKSLITLQPKTLEALAQRAFQREVQSGYNLVIEGMPADVGYFILSGQLRVSRMNKEGRSQVLTRLGPGKPVNIISLLKEQRLNHASVETLTPASLIIISAKDF